MLTYVLHRTLYAVLLLFIASVVIFYGLRVAPGDVSDVITNPATRAQLLESVRIRLGLDKPLPAQYFIFMGHLLRGNPGLSLISSEPIIHLIRRAGVFTLKLALVSAVMTYA